MYMTRRQDSLAVLGGFFVFPGGTIDPADSSDDIFRRCIGLNPAKAFDILGSGVTDPATAMAHWVAAARELFEEAGVLPAYDSKGHFLNFGQKTLRKRFYSYRNELQHGNLKFLEMLEKEKLTLATDRLYYFKHLVTPPGPWRRFDTRFFVMSISEEQRPRFHEAEVSEGYWAQPIKALQKAHSGEWKMITPTIMVLSALAEYESAEELLNSLSGQM